MSRERSAVAKADKLKLHKRGLGASESANAKPESAQPSYAVFPTLNGVTFLLIPSLSPYR